MKNLLLFIAAVFIQHLLIAQTTHKVGVEGSYGFIIAHTQSVKPISQTFPYGFSLNYQYMNSSQKKWENCNCFYYTGLQLSHHDFANREVLGSATSLSATFEPILWQNRSWSFNLMSGIGLSYLSNVYNPTFNPENTFFSAPVSFLIFVSPKIEYHVSEKWSAQMTFHYNHISNGGQSKPNKGMNYPMLGLGVNYYLQRASLPDYPKRDITSPWSWLLETGITHRQAQWRSGRLPTISLLFDRIKPVSRINALGFGLEMTKDFSLEVDQSRWEALMPSPFVSHHFIFGRLDFSQRFAVYTQKPAGYIDQLFYQRYTLHYRLFSNFSIGGSMKVHGHVAENIDFRLGWRF